MIRTPSDRNGNGVGGLKADLRKTALSGVERSDVFWFFFFFLDYFSLLILFLILGGLFSNLYSIVK